MKAIFLFMSEKSAEPGSTKTCDWMFQPCGESYEKRFGDEVYFKMFEPLLKSGLISNLKVFFESNREPGYANFVPGAECFVIPEIRLVSDFIDEDTIIFVRGGFKHWHDFLKSYKGKNWLIIYGANTGRHKWNWWDINFNDLEMSNEIDRHGRYQYPFVKPVNEEIFHNKGYQNQEFDICIGASHIHDKKGQYRGIKLMEAFHKLFHYYPRAVMPGSLRRSTHTVAMTNHPIYVNEMTCPGMLSKPDLSQLLNNTKVFLHLGTGGQNDRSILEAYATGCFIGINSLSHHTPLMKPDDSSIFHFDLSGENPDYEKAAKKLHTMLVGWNTVSRDRIVAGYKEKMGWDERAIPMLKELFGILRLEGKPGLNAKQHMQTRFQWAEGGEYGTSS